MLERLLNRLLQRAARLSERAGEPAADTGKAERLIAEGNRAEDAGDPSAACRLYREAVAAAPRYVKAHLNLGLGLEASGDAEAALASYGAALAIDSGEPYANYNLGKLLHVRGERPQAARHLRAALERKADFPEARIVLAAVYDEQGELSAAAGQLELLLQHHPANVGALYNYGLVLQKQRRLPEAQGALRRAVAADPGFPPAWRALGGVLYRQSRMEEALAVFREALARNPDDLALRAAELFALTMYDGISAEDLFARHRSFGEALEKSHAPRFEPFANDRDPGRKLRIGYVSGDFYTHPVTLFLMPVLDRHDRSAYSIHCYWTGERSDALTRQVASRADVWCEAASLSDAELADTIHRDAVDILVDLSGHSGRPRLGVFAQQPAPVQATWLGYLNTTGTTRIRYRISDGRSDPPGASDALHTETLSRLPHSQWCYRPFLTVDCAETPPLVANGFVTFGSFNEPSKISRSSLELWAEILLRLPDSRLVLVGAADGHPGERVARHFASAGIAPGRIELLARFDLDEYFRCYDRVDIALDTMPNSGGTTTCDALWMGVPVVTAPGTRSASRSAASILTTAGLPEWIASSPADYVRLAVESARDRAGLIELRKSLRRRMRESPLMDESGFTHDLEQAYRRMWTQWCMR